MLCQNCNKKTASVHFVKVINDVKTEMHLCDTCAAANQEVSSVDNFDITVSDIINSFYTNAIRCNAKHANLPRLRAFLR